MTECPFPIVDAHTHLFYPREYLPRLFQEIDLRVVVINITGHGLFDRNMEERWQAMVAMKERYPERVFLCTTFEPDGIGEPDFAERVIRGLLEDLSRGANLVKVWKDIGLRVRDPGGSWVQIDDDRFQPIWEFLSENDVPVLAHIAEPKAAWKPLDRGSPHFQYYRDHPEHHLYLHPETPSWDELIAARDRWIAANPDLQIIGAHLGSMAHDVDEVAKRLDQFPNFYVDTAERFGDLYVQPTDRVRRFFMRYADRILYGTDVLQTGATPANENGEQASYRSLLTEHWHYLAGSEEMRVQGKLVDPITARGLGLPREALEKVYYGNATRLVNSKV